MCGQPQGLLGWSASGGTRTDRSPFAAVLGAGKQKLERGHLGRGCVAGAPTQVLQSDKLVKSALLEKRIPYIICFIVLF